MPWVVLEDGTKLHYIESGHGTEVIVFLHGNLANTIWWETTLQKLPTHYHGLAFDLPGSGQSPETQKRHTMEYFSQVLEAFVTKLGLSQFILVGHSMGGGVAQLYTIQNPQKVKKLVLLDTIAADGFHLLYELGPERLVRMRQDKEFLALSLQAIAPGCKNPDFLVRVTEAAYGASEQVFLEQPITMHEVNWMDRIHNIKCPVLFMHGMQDHFVPMEGSLRTAAKIENCVFIKLPDCGHSPMAEKFDEYFRFMLDFLAR